jgi:hypothetical protein
VQFGEVWGYLGVFSEGLRVLVKHFTERFWEGVIKILKHYWGSTWVVVGAFSWDCWAV